MRLSSKLIHTDPLILLCHVPPMFNHLVMLVKGVLKSQNYKKGEYIDNEKAD